MRAHKTAKARREQSYKKALAACNTPSRTAKTPMLIANYRHHPSLSERNPSIHCPRDPIATEGNNYPWPPPPPPPPPLSRTTTQRPAARTFLAAPSIGDPYSTTSTSRYPPFRPAPAGSAAPPALPQLPAAHMMPTSAMVTTDTGTGRPRRPCSGLHRRGSERKATASGRASTRTVAPGIFTTTRAATRRTSMRDTTTRMRPNTSASRFPRRRSSLPHRRPVREPGAAM
jgi:hypothetical protein